MEAKRQPILSRRPTLLNLPTTLSTRAMSLDHPLGIQSKISLINKSKMRSNLRPGILGMVSIPREVVISMARDRYRTAMLMAREGWAMRHPIETPNRVSFQIDRESPDTLSPISINMVKIERAIQTTKVDFITRTKTENPKEATMTQDPPLESSKRRLAREESSAKPLERRDL